MSDPSTMRRIRTSTRSLMTARPHLPERASASPEMTVLRSGYARLRPFNPGPFSSRLTLLSHLDCRRADTTALFGVRRLQGSAAEPETCKHSCLNQRSAASLQREGAAATSGVCRM